MQRSNAAATRVTEKPRAHRESLLFQILQAADNLINIGRALAP
jgi:hypothetical protein